MKYDYILESVAKKNGVSKQEVIREIEKSIQIAMNDPKYKDKWDKIRKGKMEVTVDDFLEYCLTEISKKDLI